MKKVFAGGFFFGILLFILIYGVSVLDVTGDGWVFKSDNDLRQHYLGWMAYRDSAFSFPLGMTDRLSYPESMSIVYTDSIPLVALAGKLLSPLLPRPFQYFGWYALLSFGLTCGLGTACIRLLSQEGKQKDPVKNGFSSGREAEWTPILGVLTVLSYPMLQRTFYHTSLASQWIILLCFYLWFSRSAFASLSRRMLIWAFLGLLCVMIHTYFLPMSLVIMCACELERFLAGGRDEGRRFSPASALRILILPVSMGLSAFAGLWIMGAFEIKGAGEYWIGDFTMNLNSFVNPLGKGLGGLKLPLYGQMQFEGAAYLGLGVMAMAVFTAAVCLFRLIRQGGQGGSFDPASVIRDHPRALAMAVCALVFAAAAILPTVSLGDRLLFRLPLTAGMNRLFGIFRSNGRFIWPVMYIVLFTLSKGLCSLRDKGILRSRMVLIICALAVLLQAVDYYPWMLEKHEKYVNAQKTYRTVWDEIDLPDIYDGFIIFEDDNSFIMGTAYYAMRHGMTVNTFYFARDIDRALAENEEGYRSAVLRHDADPKKVYVLDRETYEELKDSGLYFYRTRKCAFGVKERIEGLKELTPEDLDDISWQ